MQKNVLEYLEDSAARFPEKAAFADERQEITFSRLLELSRRGGSFLAQNLSAVNRPIAVMTDRTAASVLAFFSVLQSGNFYVPIDSAMPRQRMALLLEKLSPAAVIFSEGEPDSEFPVSCPVFLLAELQEAPVDDGLLAERRSRVLDIDPVYAIFTSGSTGVPKGIVIGHRNVIDFTDWFTDTMGICEDDVLGNQAPFFFDLSVKDLYTALKTGATVRILPKKCFAFPVLLIQLLNEYGVTTLSWATSAFHLTANSRVLEKHLPTTLRRVILGGEALQAKQLNLWRRALPEVKFVNLYGPTEVTVDCTCYPIEREFADDETIPIGKACANKEVFLLDEQNLPPQQGEPGEICVRGTGVAKGYYHDPEKTAAVFVQNPLNPWYPDLIYRTGDLGYFGEDGLLYFSARKDGQIKHGGYRIELGEVETAVNGLSEIGASVCFFDAGRDKIVCVYQGELSGQELASKLRERLPKYMIPNVYTQVEAMPYNANGKIDRVRLREDYDRAN